MSHAVCIDCGNVQYWHAGRGCRLADVRCEKCRGQVKAYRDGQHSSGSTGVRGLHKYTCALCGRRGFTRVGVVDTETPVVGYDDKGCQYPRTVPAGTAVCWWHVNAAKRLVQEAKP